MSLKKVMDPTGTDMLSNITVGDNQKRKESDEPLSRVFSEVDGRNGALSRDGTANSRSPKDSSVETGQRLEDVPRCSQRSCQEGYNTLSWVIPLPWLYSRHCRGSVQFSHCH